MKSPQQSLDGNHEVKNQCCLLQKRSAPQVCSSVTSLGKGRIDDFFLLFLNQKSSKQGKGNYTRCCAAN